MGLCWSEKFMNGYISDNIIYNRRCEKIKLQAKQFMVHKYGRILDCSSSIKIKIHY